MDIRRTSPAIRCASIICGIILTLSTAQAQFYTPGVYVVLNPDTVRLGRIRIDVDTIQFTYSTSQLIRIIDSAIAASASGGTTYVKDVDNLAGTIDSANGLYTLHYAMENTFYVQGAITSFSNQATDSTTIAVGVSASQPVLLPGVTPVLERFSMFDGQGGYLIATFDAHPPIGNDSLLIGFHIVNTGGVQYITVWKYKLSNVTLTVGVTTAGTMILKQIIAPGFVAVGTTSQFRFAFWANRVRR